MRFSPIRGYQLEVSSSGRSNGRILVFRSGGEDVWEQVGNARVLVVGGPAAKRELRQLLLDVGRPSLQEYIPGGISSSVHTALREYVGLS